jgi:murein L,D-transpeptidase YcbB/YkuD
MRARSPAGVALCLTLACWAASGAAVATQPLDVALERYRAIAEHGGWPAIPPGRALEPGMQASAVRVLRSRLLASGDAPAAAAADPSRYDAALAHAVEAFQRRHGLHADGVVGETTRTALNVPIGDRIAELELARMQATEPAPHGRWIRINVPAFWLQVLDGADVVLEMPVVVGRPSRPTPLFEKTLSQIVFNPPWTLPPDLAFHDVLPKILADPGYLARRQIDVYESGEPGAARLDPARIDWKHLGARIEGLMLRQRPGPGNGLGRMMFRMDGEQEIFLHDTPAREVFQLDRRDLSSGCIRVANAEGLARAVLGADGMAQLASWLARRDTFTVTLGRPVPVRTVYETAWVDEDGQPNFRDDLYAEAPRLAAALNVAAAAPSRSGPQTAAAARRSARAW